MNNLVKYYILIFHLSGALFTTISYTQPLENNTLINFNDTLIDTVKVKMLYDLSAEMFYENIDSSLKYAQKALDAAQKINFQKGYAISCRYIGNCYGHKNKYTEAIKYYRKSMEVSKLINNKDEIAKNLFGIGAMYKRMGDYSNALDYFEQVLTLKSFIKDKKVIGETMGNIAASLGEYGKTNEAISFFLNSLDTVKKYTSKTQYASHLSNLATAFTTVNQQDSALKYSQLALDIAKNIQENKIPGFIYRQHGYIYEDKEDFQNALKYYNKSLQIHKKINNEKEIALDMYTIGYAYELQNDIERALSNYQEALVYAKKTEAKYVLIMLYSGLYYIYMQKQDYKNALDNHVLYTDILYQTFNDESSKQVEKIIIEYETKEKEQEIIRKNNELKLLEQEKRISNLRKLVIIISLSVFLVIGLFMYVRLRKHYKSEKELYGEEIKLKNTDLTNFALNIYNNFKFTENIKENIRNLKYSLKDRKLIKQLECIENQLLIKLQVEKDKSEFKNKIKDTYQTFYNNLTSFFPNLSKNEKQLATLLRLNLSSKEIASIFNISVKSVEMNRYRLRKKLNIRRKDNLSNFLLEVPC